ncbi:hypothetical protein IV203_031453 [Nitzschia inconspicua]|uniref:Uncharacterized protein n=1 Tax=Nitzschia inconspicua TaxID=303405 RepID=A0A9K3Q356_9STRA|nr:hypothetical protein IV203_031453 [Nitzschia inconspicua]
MYSAHNPYNKINGSSVTTVSTETLLRNLISTCSASVGPNFVTPQLAAVQAIHEQLVSRRDVEWTLDLAQGLGTIVGKQLAEVLEAIQRDELSSNTEVSNATLLLLHEAMEDWPDHVLYAVMVQDYATPHVCRQGNSRGNVATTPGNLLDHVMELVLQKEYPFVLHQTAMNVLALAWRSFDWMQRWLSLSKIDEQLSLGNPSDIPWWIKDYQVERLGELSVKYLNGSFEDNNEFSVRPTSMVSNEQSKLSALILIASLLGRQHLDMPSLMRILTQSQVSEIITKLIKGIQVLSHSVLPPSSSEYTIPIALMSMSVLTLLQQTLTTSTDLFQSLNQTIQSTRLVENIVDFSFVAVASQGNSTTINIASRWISPVSKRFPRGFLHSFGVTVLWSWKCTDHTAWQVANLCLQTKYHAAFSYFWSSFLQEQQGSQRFIDDLILTVICMLQLNRPNAKQFILEVIRKSSSCKTQNESQMSNYGSSDADASAKKLLHSFFHLLGNTSGISYDTQLLVARLLYNVLSDRDSVCTNDELSRCFWNALDPSFVEKHWEVVLEIASTDDKDQPLLSAMLDLLNVLSENEVFRNHLVTHVNAHNLEAMIYLVNAKEVRFDFIEADHGVMMQSVANIDTETPPQNNLSRMDETSICIEQEETKNPRGWDMTVRLTAATVLANLGNASEVCRADESAALVLSRISNALNDFLLEYQKMDSNCGCLSTCLDRTRRLLRLQIAMFTPENETFLVNSIHASRDWSRKELLRVDSNYKEAMNELELALVREKDLQKQKQMLVQQLNSQSIVFQQCVSRMKANLAKETKQIVSMHFSERTRAEQQATKAIQQCGMVTAALEKEREEAHELKNIASQTKNDLVTASLQIDELNETINILQRQLEEEKSKSSELSDRVTIANERVGSYEKNNRTMQEILNEREVVITRVSDSNHQLHDNLEDLFADMCSLSQIYQQNEQAAETQMQKTLEAADEANKKLDAERKVNVELGNKVKSLEEENDKLYRKLAKYKERLEQERKDRRDEHEQRKQTDNHRKRNGPVSYLNSLHTSNISDKSTRQTGTSGIHGSSLHPHSERSSHDKENESSSRYYTNASQRRLY